MRGASCYEQAKTELGFNPELYTQQAKLGLGLTSGPYNQKMRYKV